MGLVEQKFQAVFLGVLLAGPLQAATAAERTLFACSFNGTTGHGGLDADVAGGNGAVRSSPVHTFVEGQSGKALHLAAGIAPCGVVYDFAGNMLLSRGAVELWVKLDWDVSFDTSRKTRVWFNAGTGNSRDRILILSRDDRLSFGVYDHSGRHFHVRSNSFPAWRAGEWHQIACSWELERRHLAIWIDGELESDRVLGAEEGSWTLAPEAFASIRIGGFCGNDHALEGAVDELRISDYVRYRAPMNESVPKGGGEAEQTMRRDATLAYSALVGAIRDARQKGLHVPYAEAIALVARVGLDRAGERSSGRTVAERRSYYEYIINRSGEGVRDIRLIMEGKKHSAEASPVRVSELTIKGDSFLDVQGRDCLFVGIRNVPPEEFPDGLSPFNLDTWRSRPRRQPGGAERQQWEQVHLFWNRDVSKALAKQQAAANVGGYSGGNWTEGLCIDSQTTRQVIERAMRALPSFQGAEEAGHLYGLLSAEDRYMCYCSESADLFRAWLTERYRDVATLNAAWNTHYGGFNSVSPTELFLDEDRTLNRAAWSDWLRFNRDRVTAFYVWLKSVARQKVGRLPLNAGTQLGLSDRRFGVYGIDVEALNREVNDVAQSETLYGLPTARADLGVPAYGLDIHAEARVDFQRSTCDLPVTDLEFHGWSAYLNELYELNQVLPKNYTSAILYRHFLHGVRAANLWVYKSVVTTRSSFCCSGLIPLESVEECFRAALDIRRLTPEIVALTKRDPALGILFSDSTFFQIPRSSIKAGGPAVRCTAALDNAYHASLFLGTPIGFVTERQIAGEGWGKYRVIVVPGASHVPPEVFHAMMGYVERGGVLVVTPASFLFDQYHRLQSYWNDILPIQSVQVAGPSSTRVTPFRGDEPFLETLVTDPGDARIPGVPMRTTGKGPLAHRRAQLRGVGVQLGLATDSDDEIVAVLDDGSAGIVSTRRGKGWIIVCAMDLKPRSFAFLLDAVLDEARVEREIRLVDEGGDPVWGVEARACRYKGDILLYAVNLLKEEVAVALHSESLVVEAVYDCLSERMRDRAFVLSPLETVILRVKVGSIMNERSGDG